MNQERSDVLDLRSIFGVEARLRVSSSSTGGEYVELDCTAEPGSGTMVHYHPEQDESFQVLEGTLHLLRDGEWSQVSVNESATVGRGTIHAWKNAGPGVVRFLNVHRPAGGFQDHMEMLDRLVRIGKVRGTTDLRSLIYMSMSAVKYRPDVTVKPPQWLVRAMAALGRLLGLKLEESH
jgi:quercetin dioxygenase-like cupin family protein